MTKEDIIKNYEIVYKVNLPSRKRLLNLIIDSVNKFKVENSKIPSIAFLPYKLIKHIKQLYFKNPQTWIPFKEIYNKKLLFAPDAHFYSENGLTLISLGIDENFKNYIYLRIQTPDHETIKINLQTSIDLKNELLLIYDSLNFEKNIKSLESLSDFELYELDYNIESSNIKSQTFDIKKDISLELNLIYGIDYFIYKKFEIPNIMVINEKKYCQIESERLLGKLKETKVRISGGVLSNVGINFTNEDNVKIIIDDEIFKVIYLHVDFDLPENKFKLIFDSHFVNDDDNDEDGEPIINFPVDSPVYCEV